MLSLANSEAILTPPRSSPADWASGLTAAAVRASLSVLTDVSSPSTPALALLSCSLGLLQATAMREPCFSKLSSPSCRTPPSLKGLGGLSLVVSDPQAISRYGSTSTTSPLPPVVRDVKCCGRVSVDNRMCVLLYLCRCHFRLHHVGLCGDLGQSSE